MVSALTAVTAGPHSTRSRDLGTKVLRLGPSQERSFSRPTGRRFCRPTLPAPMLSEPPSISRPSPSLSRHS
jgi:hypothetical protein